MSTISENKGWEDAIEFKSELRQRDLEAYETAFFNLGGDKASGIVSTSGATLKSAIEAKWIVSPLAEVLKDEKGAKRYFYDGQNIDDAHPGEVILLANKVAQLYNSLLEIPGN